MDACVNQPNHLVSVLPSTRAGLRADITAGFLVFLIALPLCLAISLASGIPATAGVLTAIIGGLITPWISNSELTIKGPAAGLIVIVLGCVVEFGGGPQAEGEAAMHAYRLMLGVAVAAGALQVLLALFRAGAFCELLPLTVVHGMLSAIGVIILSKQVHVLFGVRPHAQEPLELLAEIPRSVQELNPEIALVGLVSLGLLSIWPLLPWRRLQAIPASLVVVVFGVVMAYALDLEHHHTYTFRGHDYELGEQFLVGVPRSIAGALMTPDFSSLLTWTGWKWAILFVVIGTLESLLSVQAVDILDPYRRTTDVNRDLLAVGAANIVAGAIGGSPMISEIVRSKAAIDYGAQTRKANFFHGLFLLAMVSLFPGLIHRIPLTCLAAMLVYTGFRLAHPREFVHMYRIGIDQLLIYLATMIGVLATDLLIGVGMGIATKILIHVWNGATVRSFVAPKIDVDMVDNETMVVRMRSAAVFSSWIAVQRQIWGAPPERRIVLDLSDAGLVDHTFLEKVHQLQTDLGALGRRLCICGLDEYRPFAKHPQSARKKKPTPLSPAASSSSD
jgi:MFS superfamily sulfate permease-like transporter